jgi:hypothetical protein
MKGCGFVCRQVKGYAISGLGCLLVENAKAHYHILWINASAVLV